MAMKLKTTTLCVGAALVNVTPALAQQNTTNVTIYGQLDQAIEYIDKGGAKYDTTDTTIKDRFRLSPGMVTSMWGIRGTENLGGGLKAIFNLESGFSPEDGTQSQGGRLFGRQAYVGLDDPKWGRLTLGRQYSMRYYAVAALNPFGTGTHGLATLDDRTGDARTDNLIAYRNRFGNFELGVDYSAGRSGATGGTSSVAANCGNEVAHATTNCRAWGVLVKYDADNWGISSGYERNYGGAGAYNLTSTDMRESRAVLGGYLKYKGGTFGLGWLRRHNEGTFSGLGSATSSKVVGPNTNFNNGRGNLMFDPESDLVWLSWAMPVTDKWSFDGVLGQLKYRGSYDGPWGSSTEKAQMVVLRGVYSLSRRTALYVSAERMDNKGKYSNYTASNAVTKPATDGGGAQLSVLTGIRHRF